MNLKRYFAKQDSPFFKMGEEIKNRYDISRFLHWLTGDEFCDPPPEWYPEYIGIIKEEKKMNIAEKEYIQTRLKAEQLRAKVALEQLRPFHLLKPKISIDGNQWCALYGENLQDGVAGFGDTPELAARDFDFNFRNQKVNLLPIIKGKKRRKRK